MRATVIYRRGERQKLRVWGRGCVSGIKVGIMVSLIDVAPDAVAHSAADERVAEEVVAPGVTRDAHGRRKAVGSNAHERAALPVFFGNDGRKRPGADRVPGWKRVATVEEFAARIVHARAWTLCGGF